MYSGTRAGSSIWVAHLAIGPNMAREFAFLGEGSRSVVLRAIWPTRRIYRCAVLAARYAPPMAGMTAPGPPGDHADPGLAR